MAHSWVNTSIGRCDEPEQVCGLQLVHPLHGQPLGALLPTQACQQGSAVAVNRRQHHLADIALLVQRQVLHLSAVLGCLERRCCGRHPRLCDVDALLAALAGKDGPARQPHAVQVAP